MALYHAVVTWIDEDFDRSREGYFIEAASGAAALVILEPLVEAADVLSLGRVADVSLTEEVDISGWTLKAAAEANSDVEIGGRFVFATAVGKSMIHTIPAFDKNTYSTVGGLIDIADADVLDWFDTNMIDVAGNVDSNDEDLTALNAAYEVFGGKR